MLLQMLAAKTTPAAGAAIGQVIIATVGGWPSLRHARAGRRAPQRTPEDRRPRCRPGRARVGRRGWAALPGALLGVSLLTAVFGMYWDISLHLDNGRDPGPLANPAHYFILIGLFGVLFAGVAAIALPLSAPGRRRSACPTAGGLRSGADRSRPAGRYRCSPSRSTTYGIACSART